MTLFLFGLILLMLLVSRLILKTWKLCYFIGGLIVGLFLEIYFEYSWTYTENLKPFIWRDVPLVVLIGWGAISLFGLSISDFISLKIKSKKVSFLIDIIVLYAALLSNEIIMAALNFWTYNNDIHSAFIARITGFWFLSLIIVSVSRKIDALFLNK